MTRRSARVAAATATAPVQADEPPKKTRAPVKKRAAAAKSKAEPVKAKTEPAKAKAEPVVAKARKAKAPPKAKPAPSKKRAAPARKAKAGAPASKRKKQGLKGHVSTDAPLGVVDPESKLEGGIFFDPEDEESEPFDAMLAIVEPQNNRDAFIVLQIVELDSPQPGGGQFVLYQRWGRTGTAGQALEQVFVNSEDAVEAFKAKFEDKCGFAWEDRHDQPDGKLPGKYAFMNQNFAAKQAAVLGQNATWEYWVDDGIDGKETGWYPYSVEGSKCTEQLYQESLLNPRHSTRVVASGAWLYHVFLEEPHFWQENAEHPNRTRRYIRRVPNGSSLSDNPPAALAPVAPASTAIGIRKQRKPGVTNKPTKPQHTVLPVPHAITHTTMTASLPPSRPVDAGVSVRSYDASDFEVMKDDDDQWLDVSLLQANVGVNANKFYLIAVYRSKTSGSYYTWTRWGRVGDCAKAATSAMFGPYDDSIEPAIAQFRSKYQAKTGNSFGAEDFTSKKGKYEPVEIDHSAVVPDDLVVAPAQDVEYLPSALSQKMQTLVNTMFSKDVRNASMQALNLDLKKLPMGVPSKQQIQRGLDVLNEIKAKISKNSSVVDTFEDLSSRFYTCIPHSFPRNQRPPIIRDTDSLQERYDMCDMLIDIVSTDETMRKIETAQPKKKTVPNPVDQHYLSLNAELSELDKNSAMFQDILTYFQKTKDTPSAKLLDVFTVNRQGEAQRFSSFDNLDNRRLLFHGTNVCVAPAILTTGLRIMPNAGGRVGKGVYLASQQAKSAQYTSAYGAKFAIMFLAEAALGRTHQVIQDGPHASGLTKAPPGSESVYAVGTESPKQWKDVQIDNKPVSMPCAPAGPTMVKSSFRHDEFLVYSEAQMRLRFLLTVKLH